MDNTLIIIPTYNEKGNIRLLIEQILATVPHAHVVVVDDGSPDGTAEIVGTMVASSGGSIHLICRTDERGLGTAYKAGFAYGLRQAYTVLVTMDGDHSHDPKHLPDMLVAAQNHDIVIGSRYIREGKTVNWAIWRLLLSWTANLFARMVLNVYGNDLTSGYRVYRREILELIDLEKIRSNGYSFLVEVLFYAQRQRASICEIPIVFLDRTRGTSKISKHEIYRGALTLFRLRFHRFFTKGQ